MTVQSKSSLVASLEKAAALAGLTLLSTSSGSDFNGEPTVIFQLGISGLKDRSLQLELSEAFANILVELLLDLIGDRHETPR